MSEAYPENRPEVTPLDRFTFDTQAGQETAGELDLEIKALEQRIERIVRRVDIQGIPLLHHILGLTHDRKELIILANCLKRVADLMPELDRLKRKRSFIDVAMNDPHWLAATFADFSEEVETIIPGETDTDGEG